MNRFAVVLLMMSAPPALAQEAPMATGQAAPVCPKDAEPLPAALSGWSDRKPLVAAKDEASLGGSVLAPGIAADLALADTPAVRYVVRPAHPGGSVSHGGMLAFTAGSPGTYRIAIGSGAWIDVVRDDAALASIAHGHGPNCSGVRKMVDFVLQPGAYVLEIAGNGDAHLAVMIAKLD